MINAIGGVNYYTVSWNPSKEVDVVAYTLHEGSTSDFTPDLSNRVMLGPATSFYKKTTAGNKYLRVAAIDTFEDLDNINYSGLNYANADSYPVVVTDLEILPEQLNSTQRVDFALENIRFYFAQYSGGVRTVGTEATLYWEVLTGGKLYRGDSEYTISDGSIAAANGKYIVAVLNDGAGTFTIKTPMPSLSAGLPTLATNEVIIGTTSTTRLTNDNFVAYLRQSNSVMYEGAIIREATIGDAHITGVLSASKIVANWSSIIDDNGNMPADNSDRTQTVIDGGLVTTGRLEVGNGAFGSANAGVNGSGSSGTDIRFWAGSNYAGRATAPFRVDQSGALYATDAYISGSILASTITGSTITGGTITGSTIQTASGSVRRFVVSDTNNQAEFYGNRGDGTIEKLGVIGIDSYLGLGIDYVASLGSINGTVGALAATSDSAKTIRSNSTSGIALLTESTTGYGAWLGQDVMGTYRQGLDGFVGTSPCRLAPGNGAGAPTHSAEIGSLWVDKNGILYIQTTWRNGNGWQKVGAQ